FDELVRKQINIAGPVDYGLGWFLRQWNGHKVIEHGGNIDGFNSQVAFMPDQKLGFVLLTNVTASSLGTVAMSTIWKNLVSLPATHEGRRHQPGRGSKTGGRQFPAVPRRWNFRGDLKRRKAGSYIPGPAAIPASERRRPPL